ncbi:MAG: aldo/keto reductase [Microscillaceae bacterium]|nr:aldo/keto reductase [Microscillaceae bacterium]
MNISDIQGTVTLANGVEMPYLGLGVYQSKEGEEVIQASLDALEAGYRHIDTAALYGNERGVGQAVRESGLPRQEIFVTTKVWNSDQGYDSTLHAFENSLKKLDLEYIDLYLIHWPVKGKYKDTWRALEKIYSEGLVKSIGVSNFLQNHLEDLLPVCEIKPMVNQMEFHPYLVQQTLIDFCTKHQICYEAWSPLMQGRIFEVDLLRALAEKYQKTPVQIVLRWDLQKGVVTIPKSSKKERIITNAQIFDFELSEEDVKAIDALDRGQRVGPDPNNFNF